MPTRPRPLPVALPALSLLLLAGLAGCSSDSTPTEPGAPSPGRIAAVESRLVTLTNAVRRDAGVPELTPDGGLAAVARAHSEAMRDQGFFAHVNPATGTDLGDRLAAGGFGRPRSGENLALVTARSDPAQVAHDALFGSAEHRELILDERFRSIGVGVARSGDRWWVTQIFIR